MKSNTFHKLKNLNVNVRDLTAVTNIEYDNGHWYANSGNEQLRKNILREIDNKNYKTIYEAFIRLGKELYDENIEIRKIKYRPTIHILPCDFLILEKNKINDNIINTIKNWCKKYPVTKKESNISNRNGHENQIEIEIFALMDIAVFSYLVLSSLNNYILIHSKQEKDIKEYEHGNKIRFNDFTEIGEDNRDIFLGTIATIINQYETKIYDINNRPLLQERTVLSYNDLSKEYDLTRVFENIYSLFWIMLKTQLFALSNDDKLFNICRCGEIIIGKAKRCTNCFLANDSERHQ